MTALVCEDLGRMAYGPALDVQRDRVLDVQAAPEGPAYLLLVEHDPPVITTGRRPAAGQVLASPERLAREGIQTWATSRGGSVTYHGPGQLVGYPIVRLAAVGLGVREYVHALEDALIGLLARWDVAAGRAEGMTGVWVGEEKIAAIGVAVSRGVTYHGFALNVATDLSHFGLIVPCGLAGCSVTSLSRCLGRPVAVADVKPAAAEAVREALGLVVAPDRAL